MPVAPNLTDEELKTLERLREDRRRAEALPPPSKAFQDKMDDQALTHAKLAEDSSVHDRVMGMPEDEFEAEFADVLNANAYDDDEGAASDA